MTDPDLYSRYARIPSAVISDVLRSAGAPHQVLHHRIAGLHPGTRFAGPAFCARGRRLLGTLKASDDRRFEMYRRFPAGAVLVLDSGGYEPAVVFGENVALALKAKGCVGIVTDGGIRDKDAMAELEIPVCATFVTPLSSGKQWITTDIDVPVTLPGQSAAAILIESGDVVVTDSDGTVIVPGRGTLTVLEDAEQVMAIEGSTRERILGGADAEQVYGALPRFKHVRRI